MTTGGNGNPAIRGGGSRRDPKLCDAGLRRVCSVRTARWSTARGWNEPPAGSGENLPARNSFHSPTLTRRPEKTGHRYRPKDSFNRPTARYHGGMSNTPFSAPDDALVVAGLPYRSRLLTGNGKFKDLNETLIATEASGAEIVTVAIRRTNIGQNPGEPNLLDVLPPDRYTILPNSAGCYTADDAVRTRRLAREMLDGHALDNLDVYHGCQSLLPDLVATLKLTEILV